MSIKRAIVSYDKLSDELKERLELAFPDGFGPGMTQIKTPTGQTLDALLCGIPVVSSNVGLFYKDIPEDCFVKIEWERNNDLKYIEEKLNYAWENKEILSKKGREWYLANCNLNNWITHIQHTIK